jgi:hypothetical protein
MRTIRIVSAIVFWTAAFAQSETHSYTRVMSGSATQNNVGFSYETRLEPPSPTLANGIGGGTIGGTSATHRFMTDSAQRKYFGYDILVEALPQPNTYRVTFRPLSISAEKIHPNDPAGWTMVPLSGYPAPQTVHGGDTIALDLFTNPATGQKIVDYIRIKDRARELVYANDSPPRDFSVADAELRLMAPHVSINGKLHPATADQAGGIAGAAVWFYLPDHGRYFLSLMPHPELGFQKAGEVRGSSLNFTAGGDTITVECNGRIAVGYAAYNLYVLAEPGWRPRDPHAQTAFGMTAGDHIESFLHH